MTIRAGVEWGDSVARPDGLVVAGSDAELAALVAGGAAAPLAVAAGDLRRTLGAGTHGPAVTTVQRVPLDVIRVRADDVELLAVAHVVARRSWWRGRLIGVFNCEHLGAWDVAPRAHPNDGRVDVVEVDQEMRWRARLQAWRRLPSGTHVPHPAIRLSRRESASWEFPKALRLFVDGRARGRVRRLTVTVEPDAFHLHI